MLMVTTTVGMVDWVHSNTTGLGPRVALDGVLMLRAGCLEQGLVRSSSTSDNADHSSSTALDHLLRSTRQLDSRLASIWVVSDDRNVVARRAAQSASVTGLLFHIRHDGTFGDGAEGQDVSDGQSGVLACVDELAGVHALVGDEGLGDVLEFVRAAEGDSGERCPSAGVVDYVFDDAAHVAMSLREIEGPEFGRRLVEAGMGREN